MPKKRGNGEGSIRKRADGTWEGRITTGTNPNGNPKRRSFYGKTRAEVAEKMTAALDEVNKGTYKEPSKMTFGQWLDIWMEEYKKRIVKPKTYEGYEQMIRLYIKPAVGNIKLTELLTEQLQSLLNDMADRNLATSTINQTKVVINSALKQAVINKHVHFNIASGIVRPKTHEKKSRPATEEEQSIIMKALESNKYGSAFLLALHTGMRKGEILALKWIDVDFDKKCIAVNRTLNRVKDFDADASAKTKIHIGTPKSESSERSIPMNDDTISLLKAHRRKQAEHILSMGGCYNDEGYLFTNDFGKHLEPRYFSKFFDDLKKETGITDLTIHSLRHTFANRVRKSGTDMKVLQDLLGHATYATTADIYASVSEDEKINAMSKISDNHGAATGKGK